MKTKQILFFSGDTNWPKKCFLREKLSGW